MHANSKNIPQLVQFPKILQFVSMQANSKIYSLISSSSKYHAVYASIHATFACTCISTQMSVKRAGEVVTKDLKK